MLVKIGYQRVSRAADAIQFTIDLPPELLNGALLEVNEGRLDVSRFGCSTTTPGSR